MIRSIKSSNALHEADNTVPYRTIEWIPSSELPILEEAARLVAESELLNLTQLVYCDSYPHHIVRAYNNIPISCLNSQEEIPASCLDQDYEEQ